MVACGEGGREEGGMVACGEGGREEGGMEGRT